MPFGLKNAPAAIFQRYISYILRVFIGEFCYVYLDDIFVFSPSVDAHKGHLCQLFKQLHDHSLYVQMSLSPILDGFSWMPPFFERPYASVQ
jgi:hypothetical protein